MRDYSHWLYRAETFVRTISTLAGEWSVEIAIAPPMDQGEADRLSQTLPHGLPCFLRDYYVTASAAARVHYSWKPLKTDLAIIGKVVPHQYTLYGGPTFCAAAELLDHHDRLVGFAEVLEELGGFGTAAAPVLRQSVPLIEIGNGDYIAWHAVEGNAGFGMYYVSHETDEQEESPIFPICDDLEHFADVWENLGYVGPEFWILDHFREPSSGMLDANSAGALRWRMILKNLGLPVEE